MIDPDRFLGLLEPCRNRLVLVSRSLVRRRADADDAVQEAVLKAWQDFPRYREGRSFGAWILRYLVNTVRNRNRRLHHELEVPLPAELEDPETLLRGETTYEEFFRAPETLLDSLDDELAEGIRNLSPAARAVFLLRAVAELSYGEIAEALDIPEGTAMSHLSRARKQLRVFLSQRAAERPPGGEGGRS